MLLLEYHHDRRSRTTRLCRKDSAQPTAFVRAGTGTVKAITLYLRETFGHWITTRQVPKRVEYPPLLTVHTRSYGTIIVRYHTANGSQTFIPALEWGTYSGAKKKTKKKVETNCSFLQGRSEMRERARERKRGAQGCQPASPAGLLRFRC